MKSMITSFFKNKVINLEIIRVLFITLSLIFSSNFLYAQCAAGCTWTVTGSNSTNCTVNAGQKLCITSTGDYSGDLTLNGGTVCNNGTLRSDITFNSGRIDNYGDLTFSWGSGFLLSTGDSVYNYSGTINFLGNLTISGGAVFINNQDVIFSAGKSVIIDATANGTIENNGKWLMNGDFTNHSAMGFKMGSNSILCLGGGGAFLNSGVMIGPTDGSCGSIIMNAGNTAVNTSTGIFGSGAEHLDLYRSGGFSTQNGSVGPATTYMICGSYFDCIPTPNLSITLVGDTICVGETGTLTATASGPPGYTFVWTGGGITGNTATHPSTDNQTDNPVITTTYKVVVTATNGDKDSATADIVVNPLPVANAGSDDTICFNGTAQLTATGGTSYVWSTATFLNNPNIFNPVFTGTTAGTFEKEVTVTNAAGCLDKDTVSITVSPDVDPTLTGPTDTLCLATANTIDLTTLETGTTGGTWSGTGVSGTT
ncbi:MAG: hypothetical protein J5I47_12265, partial [Vicingus serpentipes]|nr:hypothetical protein [Vicingus serpentipes]